MPPKAAADPKAKAKAAAKGKAKAKKEEVEEEPKVPRPDRKTLDEALEKITEKIEKLQTQVKKCTEKIDEKSGGKDDYNSKRAVLRAQLDEFGSKIDALMAKKAEIQGARGNQRQEGQEMRAELNKMKKSVGYTNEADIDQRIHDIESRMVTESIPLKEEKELLKEISELKKRRPQIAKLKNMETTVLSFGSGSNFKEQLDIINDEIRQYRDGKSQVQTELKNLQEARSGKVGDLSGIFAEREEFQKQIRELIQERNQVRDDFRQKEREFNQWEKEQREKRQAVWAEERAAKQAEWEKEKRKRAAEKLDDQPYVSEITMIEQTIKFCKSLTATKEVEVQEEKKEIQHDLKQGEELLVKKEDRDEYFFVPTAKKKSKAKNKGTKAEGGSKAIKHNAITFKLFDSLKLEAPITTDDIPPLLEKLDELLASYHAKVKEWEEKREDMKRKILEGAEIEEKAEEAKPEEGDAEKAEEKTDE